MLEDKYTNKMSIIRSKFSDWRERSMKYCREIDMGTRIIKLGDRLAHHPIILTGTTILLNRQYSLLLVLVLITLFVGSMLVYLVPFSYNPSFDILPGPYYSGKSNEYRRVLEKLVEAEGKRLARKRVKMDEETQLKILHKYSEDNAKNVTIAAVGDYIEKANLTLPSPGEKNVDKLRERMKVRKEDDRNRLRKSGLDLSK